MPEYVTVHDVEIVSAGRQWKGLTGEYYVTGEHLADMVAAQADPLIRAPRVKLGHLDPRLNPANSHDPEHLDGEPAFGTVTNLRLDEGGAKIIGDLIEVPDWLAAALPSAYPTRSAEWVWDWTTQGGKHYLAILTDVSLLGPLRPAVEDLADITRDNLRDLLEQGPDALAAAASAARTEEEASVPETPAASVSVDRIAHAFEFEWVVDPDSSELDTYWWWCRDVRVDPDEVIASDGEGGTYRVPFTTDGENAITFGEPVQVRQTYVDLEPAAAASAAQARAGQRVLAHDRPRPDKPDRGTPNPAASVPPEPTQEVSMPEITPEQLQRLRALPEDADQDAIDAALAGTEPGAEADEPDMEAPEVEAPEPEPEPVAASTRVVPVDRGQFERLQADAAAGRQARQTQLSAEMDGLVEAAVRDGRIAPASRDDWRRAIDPGENPDAAATARSDRERQALASLQPNRVPVTERGVAASDTANSDALYDAWAKSFPSSTVAQED